MHFERASLENENDTPIVYSPVFLSLVYSSISPQFTRYTVYPQNKRSNFGKREK